MKKRKSKEQLRKVSNDIVEELKLFNYFSFTVKEILHFSIAIPKLEAHKIIIVDSVYPSPKKEETQVILKRGENFLKAQLKGGYNYIKEMEEEIAPPKWKARWDYVSSNQLLVNILSSLIGFLLGAFLT